MITNTRDSDLVKKGWLTPQQGDTDRLTLQAQEAAVAVAKSNIAAHQSLIRELQQQKSYQSVVAPFDGVITQRNVDIGSLVQSGSRSRCPGSRNAGSHIPGKSHASCRSPGARHANAPHRNRRAQS